jgi:hypothetical protein
MQFASQQTRITVPIVNLSFFYPGKLKNQFLGSAEGAAGNLAQLTPVTKGMVPVDVSRLEWPVGGVTEVP